MRFRPIGGKTPGHPVLWFVALAFFTLAAGVTAYDCSRDYMTDTYGNVISRIAWPGLLFWGGLTIFLAARTIRVAGVCYRMFSRSDEIRGLCPACGYDLRATPERCPECGRVV